MRNGEDHVIVAFIENVLPLVFHPAFTSKRTAQRAVGIVAGTVVILSESALFADIAVHAAGFGVTFHNVREDFKLLACETAPVNLAQSVEIK